MRTAHIELRPDLPYLPLLYPNLGAVAGTGKNPFVDRAFACFNEPIVQLTDDPAQADYFLVPHEYRKVKDDTAYLARLTERTTTYGKPIVVVNYGDAPCVVDLPHSLSFVSSAYRRSIRPNERMMPAYAEDLLGQAAFVPRPKSAEPVIAFCGWSDYKNLKNALGTLVGDAIVDLRALLMVDPRIRAEKKGLTFRRAALRALEQEPGLRPNFLIRKSYSGHVETISLPPEQARAEYVANMRESDLALVVKGDGNYSYRFYEALALGRIPLFIDTETPLPLEDVVEYDSFLLRFDYTQIHTMPQSLREWWAAASGADIEARQQRARSAFANYLRPDRFFAYAFEHLA